MNTQIAVGVVAVLVGGWMAIDGTHVLVKGKYIGPPEPGPWSYLVRKVGIDPFAMGVPFIVLGGLWLVCGLMYSVRPDQFKIWMVLTAICTLWYLPFGTLLSIVTIVLVVSQA